MAQAKRDTTHDSVTVDLSGPKASGDVFFYHWYKGNVDLLALAAPFAADAKGLAMCAAMLSYRLKQAIDAGVKNGKLNPNDSAAVAKFVNDRVAEFSPEPPTNSLMDDVSKVAAQGMIADHNAAVERGESGLFPKQQGKVVSADEATIDSLAKALLARHGDPDIGARLDRALPGVLATRASGTGKGKGKAEAESLF